MRPGDLVEDLKTLGILREPAEHGMRGVVPPGFELHIGVIGSHTLRYDTKAHVEVRGERLMMRSETHQSIVPTEHVIFAAVHRLPIEVKKDTATTNLIDPPNTTETTSLPA